MNVLFKRDWRNVRLAFSGASRAALLIISLTTAADAFIDTNSNGVSDIWEKQYNSGNLFTAFDPQADPDGDDWTNEVEAISGTDPSDGNPPTGCVRPTIAHIPAVYTSDANGEQIISTPEAEIISWPTIAGKKYTFCSTADLSPESWFVIDSFIGDGSLITANIQLTQPDGSRPEKLFWRVDINDADSDGDNLTDSEESQLGTSSFFTDSNDDGIGDLNAALLGLNPAGDAADADSDGVPDNKYYSVEFEFEYETHYNSPPEPFLYTDREDLNSRYFTQEWGSNYSVAGSPRYVAIADGSYLSKTTLLDDGVLLMDGSEIVTEEGEQLNPWLSTHQFTSALASDEYFEWLAATQTVVTDTVTTVTNESTHYTTTTTSTTPWAVKKRLGLHNEPSDPVQQSGTEVIANTGWSKLSELMSYPDFWENYVKPTPWETWTQNRGPLYQVGQLIGSVGERDAALIVREAFKNGSFSINGTISSPDGSGTGRDERIKSVRWRWVRFDPLNPFEYDHSAPPASYLKTFRLPVTQRDRLGEDHFGDIEDTIMAKGVIEIECRGSQGGSGWQEVSMERFKNYRVADPVHLDEIGFSGKMGDTNVTVQNMPAELVSRDRMIAGRLTIPSGWEDGFEVQFVNTTTGEDLGTYGRLLDSQYGPRFDYSDTRLFNEGEQQAYETGTLDPRIRTQNVIFCGNRIAGYPIEFYTAFSAVGNVEIRLIHNGSQVGVLKQTMVADAAFGRVIDYVNELVGDPPTSTTAVMAGAPAAFGGAGEDFIRPLAKRALVPFFNGFGAWMAAQTDSEALVLGLLEGIKQGALDDIKLVEWVHAQNIHLQYNLAATLILQTQRWANDPYARAMEAGNAIRNVVQHGFIEPMQGLGGQLGDLAGNFSSWERFKEFNWKVHKAKVLGQVLALQLITDSAGVILQGLGAWYEEFCGRMYEGAELGVFQSVSMGDLPWWRQNLRTFYRTFGYSFGYLGEQLLLGKGVGALAKGLAKTGPRIALATLPAVKSFGVRVLPLFNKRWAARVITTADHEAAEQAIRAAQTGRLDAQVVLQSDGAKPVADALNDAISRQVGSLNGKLIAEEIGNSPKIMQAMRNGSSHFLDRLGLMEKLLGAKLDDVVAKNFIRTYEKTILLNANTGEDMFNLTIKSFHSNFAPNGPLDDISAAGKDLLEYFFKDPNAGSPWKLGFAGSPNQNLGIFVRGNLVELHSAKIGRHKTATYLDELNDGVVEGLDFEYADGLVVQQTSTSLSAAGDTMVQKLRDSAEAALAAKGEGCRFQFDVHWLSDNGKPDLSRLNDLAVVLRNELEIDIEIIDTVTSFSQWIP